MEDEKFPDHWLRFELCCIGRLLQIEHLTSVNADSGPLLEKASTLYYSLQHSIHPKAPKLGNFDELIAKLVLHTGWPIYAMKNAVNCLPDTWSLCKYTYSVTGVRVCTGGV
jgi:hypothetical protein